jgi:hypothetical protein
MQIRHAFDAPGNLRILEHFESEKDDLRTHLYSI